MKNRMLNFIDESYLNFEYYSRPVPLVDDKYLFDEDLLSLTGKSIIKFFLTLLELFCEECNKSADNFNFMSKLPCDCRICKLCIITKLKQITKEKVVYNEFEKRNVDLANHPGITCKCGMKYSYENSLVYLQDLVKDFYALANQRLEEIVNITCMICETKATEMDIKAKNFFAIPVIDKVEDANNFLHCMCKGCYDNKRNIVVNEKKMINIIQCQICDTKHNIDVRVWNIKDDKEEGDEASCKCCNIFWIEFRKK